MQLTIGITYSEARYENYPIWIKGNDSSIRIIRLGLDNFAAINQCDGIVLSGGIDSHPNLYGNTIVDYPNAPVCFDEERDQFELKVFEFAQSRLPMLGICRGMQLINIALGGNLVQDLQQNGQLDHRRHQQKDGIHALLVNKERLLFEITQTEIGTVNSAHHQAIDRLANALSINAVSPEGVPEGIEWNEKANKPFMLAVQWHPERLVQTDPENPFTKNIRTAFLEAVKKSKQ